MVMPFSPQLVSSNTAYRYAFRRDGDLIEVSYHENDAAALVYRDAYLPACKVYGEHEVERPTIKPYIGFTTDDTVDDETRQTGYYGSPHRISDSYRPDGDPLPGVLARGESVTFWKETKFWMLVAFIVALMFAGVLARTGWPG